MCMFIKTSRNKVYAPNYLRIHWELQAGAYGLAAEERFDREGRFVL
jgi:hypothetical protein